jgi:L-alanine-DL-glutamate epimerase-like enolase superfamily enzyme
MMTLDCQLENWELIEAFTIARSSITHVEVIKVTLTDHLGHQGVAEAAGVDYDGETVHSLAAQLSSIASQLTDTVCHQTLAQLLPRGGARNALDCALWDLRAKQSGIPAWQSAGLASLKPVTTVFTLGLGGEEDTRRKAREAIAYPLLKLKMDADRHIDIVRIVREEHPHAEILVDANQSWSRAKLEMLLPALHDLKVRLIEQPVPRGDDDSLQGLNSCIPLAADESCSDAASVAQLAPYYQYINIKLDKTGGLTEALAVASKAQQHRIGLMIGNMCGTSLAMAPAFLIAQSCRYVDLDGPLLQRLDRANPIQFNHGLMQVPSRHLWG